MWRTKWCTSKEYCFLSYHSFQLNIFFFPFNNHFIAKKLWHLHPQINIVPISSCAFLYVKKSCCHQPHLIQWHSMPIFGPRLFKFMCLHAFHVCDKEDFHDTFISYVLLQGTNWTPVFESHDLVLQQDLLWLLRLITNHSFSPFFLGED